MELVKNGRGGNGRHTSKANNPILGICFSAIAGIFIGTTTSAASDSRLHEGAKMSQFTSVGESWRQWDVHHEDTVEIVSHARFNELVI
jgi:hypothetical protein